MVLQAHMLGGALPHGAPCPYAMGALPHSVTLLLGPSCSYVVAIPICRVAIMGLINHEHWHCCLVSLTHV